MHSTGSRGILRFRLHMVLTVVMIALLALTLAACGGSSSVGRSATPTLAPPDATLYAASVSGSQGTLYTSLYALNARTGAQLWQAKALGAAADPLIVSGGDVYIATNAFTSSGSGIASTGHLYAFDAKTGKALWQQDMSNAPLFLAGASSQFVLAAAFTSSGDSAFGYTLQALNPGTGMQLWKKEYPNHRIAPVALTSSAIYIAVTANASTTSQASYTLTALRPSDGSTLWQTSNGLQGTNTTSQAVLGDGTIYVAKHDGFGTQITGTVMAFSADDGSHKWVSPPFTGTFLTPVAASGGHVYLFARGGSNSGAIPSRNLVALDAGTGTQIWSTPTEKGIADEDIASLGIRFAQTDANAVYFCSAKTRLSGQLVDSSATDSLIAVNAASGSLLWKTPADEPLSPPTVSNGTVYVGLFAHKPNGTPDTTHGFVEAFSAGDGSLKWKMATDGYVVLPPTVST